MGSGSGLASLAALCSHVLQREGKGRALFFLLFERNRLREMDWIWLSIPPWQRRSIRH
jgi:hypothetical protein